MDKTYFRIRRLGDILEEDVDATRSPEKVTVPTTPPETSSETLDATRSPNKVTVPTTSPETNSDATAATRSPENVMVPALPQGIPCDVRSVQDDPPKTPGGYKSSKLNKKKEKM